MHRHLTPKGALPAAGRRQYPETFKMLARMFLKTCFNAQALPGNGPSTAIPGGGASLSGTQKFIPQPTGGRDFSCRLKSAVPLA